MTCQELSLHQHRRVKEIYFWCCEKNGSLFLSFLTVATMTSFFTPFLLSGLVCFIKTYIKSHENRDIKLKTNKTIQNRIQEKKQPIGLYKYPQITFLVKLTIDYSTILSCIDSKFHTSESPLGRCQHCSSFRNTQFLSLLDHF